jgi:hypothetical protein
MLLLMVFRTLTKFQEENKNKSISNFNAFISARKTNLIGLRAKESQKKML